MAAGVAVATSMFTSLPAPSAPSAAAVKLVAIEKKYTVPPSRAARIEPISVFGTFTQLTTTSARRPRVTSDTARNSATASVASTRSAWSTHPSALMRSQSRSNGDTPITQPVAPARRFASCTHSVPDLPAPPTTTTVSPGRTRRAVCAGAPATSRIASATFSGTSSGSRAYRPLSNRIAWPSTSTWSRARWSARMRSMRSGVSDSDTSVAIRSPARRSVLSRSASPIAATRPISIPPEPVAGLWSLPRRATMSRIAASTRAGSPPAAARSCVKLAASTLSASTSTRISLSHGVIVLSIRAAGCGSTPAGSRTRWVP